METFEKVLHGSIVNMKIESLIDGSTRIAVEYITKENNANNITTKSKLFNNRAKKIRFLLDKKEFILELLYSGTTQTELSKILKVAQSTISNFINNELSTEEKERIDQFKLDRLNKSQLEKIDKISKAQINIISDASSNIKD